MGRQVGFFVNRQDLHSLLLKSEEAGLRAVQQMFPDRAEIESVPPTLFVLPESQDRLYLMPGEFQTSMLKRKTVWWNGSNMIKILLADNPVIEFIPSPYKNYIVGPPGRIYFNLLKEDARYDLVMKQYNRLARYIRKWPYTDKFRYYVGPRTSEEVRAGRLKLMYHRLELKLA